MKLGERLVQKLWEDLKNRKIDAVKEKIATGFQSVHQYGASNREQELELISGLNLGEYTLSNFQITQNGPVIIATYLISVSETIKGQKLSKKPAPRLMAS
jgi:hypothetical protein